jgi:hypothetical protein
MPQPEIVIKLSREPSGDWFKKLTDLATLAVIAAGLYFAYDQAEKLNKTLEQNASNINVSTWANIGTQTNELDKVLIDNPDYQEYFYDNVPISKTDKKKYAKARAIGTMFLDYVDSVSADIIYLGERMPRILMEKEPWDNYFKSLFKNSPLLCALYLEAHDSYGSSLNAIAKPICMNK